MVHRQPTDVAFYRDSPALIYLIHGVTGTPVEMRYLAKGLARHGWDLYATTLPGHCARLRDLVRTTEQEWRDHVRRQLTFIRTRYESVFVAGLSAGGLLALDSSLDIQVDGIGVLSPTFVYDGWNTPWSHALLPLAMKVVPLSLQHLVFHFDGAPFGIKDEALQARMRKAYRPHVIVRDAIGAWWARRKRVDGNGHHPSPAASKGYPIFPLRTLTEIDRLLRRVRSRLPEVTAPTVILQAREDDMTSPRNAFIVHQEISSKEKELILLDDCYHVITVDRQRYEVVDHLHTFFGSHTSGTQAVQLCSSEMA